MVAKIYLQSYLQSLEEHAIALVLTFGIAPTSFARYVGDFIAQFGNRNNATEFFSPNSQDLHIQNTIAYKNITRN